MEPQLVGSNPMKLLLCDLDGTLIDTARFKEELFDRIATIFELERTEVESVYAQYKYRIESDDWINDFTLAFDRDIWFTTKDLKRMGFVLHPILKIVTFAKQFDGEKKIFTFGSDKLQNYKVDSAGIRNIFSSIIITPKPKTELLEKWTKNDSLIIDGVVYDEVVIIDDNEWYLGEVNKHFPWITTMHPKNI